MRNSLNTKCSTLNFIGGMALKDRFAKVLYVDMRVYLGGSKVFVSEQLLYDAQVSAVLQQMSGERMSQRMRTDGLGDSRFGA